MKSSMSHQGHRIAGRYELQSLAGEGGMAKVWRAVMHGAAGFSRVVAVKEIRAEYGAIQSYVDMFVEEARVGSDLAHPNIVQAYDFVVENGSYYLVMEWVEGLDLERFLESMKRDQQPVSWELAVAVAVQVLRALQAAHERRRPGGIPAPVVHRDVSPPNVLLGINGTVKLTDFGLARARDRIYSLTAPGTVKGKLSYLSPEVTYGLPVTPMADLFSVGVVVWEMLSGRRLFPGPGDMEIFKQIRRCYVPSLRGLRPDVPERVAAAVHRALVVEPEQRFPSARALIAELVAALRATEAFSDLQSFLAHEITQVYVRHWSKRAESEGGKGEEPDGGLDDTGEEPTRPRVVLPEALETTRLAPPAGPALFSGRNVEVEFSDSEMMTLPELSPPAKPRGRRAMSGASGEHRIDESPHAPAEASEAEASPSEASPSEASRADASSDEGGEGGEGGEEQE